jgi:dienelactone hydrolase
MLQRPKAGMSLLAALIALSGMAGAQVAPTAEDRARETVQLLVDAKFEQLESLFTPDMKQALSAVAMRSSLTPVMRSLGKLQEFGPPQVRKQGEITVIVLPVKFAAAPIDFTISVNAAGQIAGLYMKPAAPHVVAYSPAAYSKPDSFIVRELTVGNDEWKLPATLTLPKGAAKLAAIVLVHGSGAHDRDETVLANKPFRDLAEGLASQGVAVLRYEKRNYVHSAKLLVMPRFTPQEETVEDAVRAVALLQTITEIDPKQIYVLGHSLGGYLLPQILQQAPNVAGGISLAGSSRPMEDLMVEQYDYLVPLQSAGSEEMKKQAAKALADVRTGATEVKALTPANVSGAPILGIPRSYWLALKSYNPPALAAHLPARLLILQGERDYQVTMTDFLNWKAALASRKDVVFKSYPALNHLFEEGVGKSTPAEYSKAGHVSAEVVEDIARWMLAH